MSLYINQEQHKDIYKNNEKINAPNQDIFMHNHMAEMIKEQKKINEFLSQNVSKLEKGSIRQENRGLEILYQLQGLKEGQLETNKVLPQLASLTEFYKKIILEAEQQNVATKELKQKAEQQLELQKQIKQEIVKQKENQQDVMKRLDSQEALSEKIVRQIDYLRSLFFERTNHLGEKIEDGYRFTRVYMESLITNRNQLPFSFLLLQKEEKKKSSD